VSDELIAVHGQAKKLSNHLHLPVQSGSATVLQRMHREYTPEHYLGLLEKLRKSNLFLVTRMGVKKSRYGYLCLNLDQYIL
jgi:tRNA A37 methylthiotransferase MiaB